MDSDVRILGGPATVAKLTRRSVLIGMAVSGAALLTGCGQGSGKVASNVAPDGSLEDRLNIYSWGDYDDPALFQQFKDEFGTVIQADAFGSNEEMIAKIAASRGTSGYDIVVPTGLMIPQMVDHQLIQPLDHSLIPNISTMDANFMDLSYDRGNRYSVTKAWGTTGFVYDRTVHTGTYRSWSDFLALATGEASGRTSLLEDAWEVSSVALGHLGIDMNTEDAADLARARDIVVDELAPHVRAYVGNAATAMSQGAFSLMQAFNGDARQGILDASDPDRWGFVFPTPTANLWTDNWCIATAAPHPDAAHRFIDWIIAPEQAPAETDYIGYPTGSKLFLDDAVEAEFERPDLIFPGQDVLDRLTASEYRGMQQRTRIMTDAQARSGV
ncbi:polyamine ABC transporter substrate-binding protein [Corynebacterium glyciniphilum]|uniref:polyamine ABC transporter substrate-binding protein n=1 Tax=Corynebacterium glyciniphilum TaxID=1404244 RepID=UPI0011AB35BE|nr:spermidine/putrescine ABC transporter substrate-binding protein [Corynebacterium glyciniphilum]